MICDITAIHLGLEPLEADCLLVFLMWKPEWLAVHVMLLIKLYVQIMYYVLLSLSMAK
jgi:hypothetical protein